jgi:hypothetical protein
MCKLLSRAIEPRDPEALGSEIGCSNAEAFDATTDFSFTVWMAAKGCYQNHRVLKANLVTHVVFLKHRIEIGDGIALLGEFQLTEVKWLGGHRNSFFPAH